MNYKLLLRHLGGTAKYKGHAYLLTALNMVQEDPELLHLVTKRLYPEIARMYNSTSDDVELCIRRLIGVMWRTNQPLMDVLMGYPSRKQPSNATFLAAMTTLPQEYQDMLMEHDHFSEEHSLPGLV